MLRHTLAALAVVTMAAALPSSAGAAVVYTLTDQVYTFAQPVDGFDPRRFFDLSLTLTNEAVATGSISVRSTSSGSLGGGLNPTFTGDVAGFVGALVDQDTVTPTQLLGSFALNLTFNPNSEIIGGSLQLIGDRTDASFTFGPSTLTGTFAGDYNGTSCTSFVLASPGCQLSGRILTSVPEPMSLALLGVGLLGTIALARRQL